MLLPLGAGSLPGRAAGALENAAGVPAKHVTLVRGAARSTLETRAATVDDFLQENGIVRTPEDAVSAVPSAVLHDGDVIEYRAAFPVTLVIDGAERAVRSAAASVGDLLAAEHVDVTRRDSVAPPAGAPIADGSVVRVTHAIAWTEQTTRAIPPPVRTEYVLGLRPGSSRIADPGAAGTRVTSILVSQPDRAVAPRRSVLASRIVRLPRARVIERGVGEYAAFAGVARRGIQGTVRLAGAALKMVATAYTGSCAGCSGVTKTGRRAGAGVVAVDPRVIPLGTRLYIPGYGRAVAGDTGGAIRGRRIDLGFESHGDAMTFGRREVVVYLLK